MHTFETPGATSLAVQTVAGRVTISAEETTRTAVDLTPLNSAGEEAVAEARVEQNGRTVVVHLPRLRGGLFRQGASVDIAITCPPGTSLNVKADSAEVRATGTFGDAVVTTGSGHIEVDTVTRSAKLKSGSGGVTAGHVGEALVATTGSGNIEVSRSTRHALLTVGSGDISIGELGGEAVTKTGSGDVEVGRLDGTLLTKTGSGSLSVRRASSGKVTARGASGNVDIGIEDGTAAWLDVSTVSGRISQELDEADAPDDGQQRVEITAHTVSGNLRVHRS
jgi:DUF4097 and DUF4098 domain-containing protein YvlB